MLEHLLTKLALVTSLTLDSGTLDLNREAKLHPLAQEAVTPEQIIDSMSQASSQHSGSGQAFGLLVRISNQSHSNHLLLEAGPQLRGHVELWRAEPAGWISLGVLSSAQGQDKRLVHSRIPNLGLELQKGQELILLAKFHGYQAQSSHLRLHTQENFISLENKSIAYLWLLLGALLVLGAYHILIWFTLRESIYLLYSTLCAAAFLATAGQSGLMLQYFLSSSPDLAFPLTQLRPWSLLVLSLFLASFLSLKTLGKVPAQILGAGYILATTLGLAGLLVPSAGPLITIGCLVLLVSLSALTYISRKSNNPFATLVLPGVLLATLAQFVFLLQEQGLVPYLWTHVSVAPLGATVMIAFLAFALGERLRYFELEQKKAEQQRALEEEQHKAEVLALNRQLEERVEEQTREIRSMLENTKIGIFSVVDNLSIHKDYARYLETILEEKEIAGRSFFEILLDKTKLAADEKDRISTAMEYSIGEDQMFFEANASCLPASLLIDTSRQKKHLDLDWSAIPKTDGSVEKILVSVRDMTETLELKSQAEAGKRMLNLLSELIELGPKRYQKFEVSCDEACQRLEPILEKGLREHLLSGEDIRQIYVVLHTIKGVSRMYKLSEITSAIHAAEELVDKRQSLTPEEVKSLDLAIQVIQERRRDYQNAMQPLLKLQKELRDSSKKSGMNDLNLVLDDLAQTADLLARELGKQGCRFIIDIPDRLKLEPHFLQALQKSLVHIIRNSIDHGLESPEIRKNKGKDVVGSLRIFLDPKGRMCLQDDGQGLRLDLIKKKSKDLLGREPNSLAEAAEVIFMPGFSTKAVADEISGRGVGMDAVREFMRAVGSDVTLVPGEVTDTSLLFHLAIDLPPASLQSQLDQAS